LVFTFIYIHDSGSGDAASASFSARTSFGKDGRPAEKESDETTYPRRHKVLAFVVAAAAMLAFAYRNGMVRIEQVPAIEEENEDEAWD
jgi:hypothetical protein